VDIELSNYDVSCQQDSDCTPITTGEICSGGCACGGSAVNVSGLPGYRAAVASLSLGLCSCPFEGSPRCLGGQCGICDGFNDPPACSDGGSTAPDAGTCVDIELAAYDQSCQVDSDCIQVTMGMICSPSCFCGGSAISASEETQYQSQTAGIANRDCPCAYDGEPRCMQNKCVLCPPGEDCGDAGGGTSCIADADCPSDEVCGFPEMGGCSAQGTCFSASQVTCNAFSPACACDGSEVNTICNGLPTGYAPKAIRHTGECVDGG
jgi:hypothetical protein